MGLHFQRQPGMVRLGWGKCYVVVYHEISLGQLMSTLAKMVGLINGKEGYMMDKEGYTMDFDYKLDKMNDTIDDLRLKIKKMKEMEEMERAEDECYNPFEEKPKKPVRTKPEVPAKPVEVIAIPPVLPGGVVIVTYPKGYTPEQVGALDKKVRDVVDAKVILLPEGVTLTSLSAGELIAMGLTQIEKVTLPEELPEVVDEVIA